MSAKKLQKNILTANLLAMAEEVAQEHEHRARFDRDIEYIRRRLEEMTDPQQLIASGLHYVFSNIVRIAKHKLRMPAAEFEAAVSVLNSAVSRVVNDCPSGKDIRDVPDWMRMTAEELRLSYSLRTPYDAADFIAHSGAIWGYTAPEIARAKAEYMQLYKARVAKRYDADRARQLEESARLDARAKAGYTRTTYVPS